LQVTFGAQQLVVSGENPEGHVRFAHVCGNLEAVRYCSSSPELNSDGPAGDPVEESGAVLGVDQHSVQ
jgi:hypothetical protein